MGSSNLVFWSGCVVYRIRSIDSVFFFSFSSLVGGEGGLR